MLSILKSGTGTMCDVVSGLDAMVLACKAHARRSEHVPIKDSLMFLKGFLKGFLKVFLYILMFFLIFLDLALFASLCL